MQKIFHNKTTGLRITDTSGKKTKAQIIDEFGPGDYVQFDIDEKVDGHKFEGGVLKKYSLADSEAETIARELIQKQEEEAGQQTLKQQMNQFRIKIGWSKPEFKALMKAAKYLQMDNMP